MPADESNEKGATADERAALNADGDSDDETTDDRGGMRFTRHGGIEFSEPEDDEHESDHSPDNERSDGFLKRHAKNLLHFFVEDWFLSAALGIITAVLSIGTDIAIEYLLHLRIFLFEAAHEWNQHMGALVWVGYITISATLAALFCKAVAPQAVGSGIPEVKVIMHGFVLKNYLSAKTLLAKVVSLILTLGGGYPVGKEGPFVHMGSIVANLLTQVTESCRYNAFFSNEGRKMEMLSSGCAVGIACTFSAPAGGVLYGIESTSKYFAVKNYWRSFFATTCAAIVFRYLLTFVVSPKMAGTITAYYQTNFPNEVFVVEEIPLFVGLGAICGLMGAMFVFVNRRFAMAKEHGIYKKMFGNRPILLTALTTALVGIITYPYGVGEFIAGKFTFRETLVDFVSNCTIFETDVNSSILCPDETIKHWTGHDGDLHPGLTMCLYIVVYFFLVAHCVCMYLPTGIFVPSFVMGAAGGRLMGEIVALYFPYGIRGAGGPMIYPGLYAVVGAAAYTGAVTHSLSIAVIVCETTGQLCALLPVLIALMVANAVSSFLQPSIYESIILMKNYPYLTDLPPSRMSVHLLKVSKVMVTDLFYVYKKMTYSDLKKMLKASPHIKGYPVVTDKESMHLIGSVSRKSLIMLLAAKLGPDPSLNYKTKRTPSEFFQSTIHSIRRSTLPNVLASDIFVEHGSSGTDSLLNRDNGIARARQGSGVDYVHAIPESARRRLLETPISLDSAAIDAAPFQLVKSTTLYKVHNMFSLLALNHAYVTERGKLVGVVSLKELRETFANIYVWGAQPPKRKMARIIKNSDEEREKMEEQLRKLREAHS
ncbi:hypothetical protein PRIPAC_87344 [Pristionchus pacificus]|uniref:Chloride channel protein n=1 Tax=Pristionchus pacificus TaxID=54126 RepID=A0A2A6CVX5_PRIPA|nr:hypothetical protein PRIPAC_87344 [Pristionchus pacificus]|eukprot:PDM82384.1 hypothetical protein PRIPAC_36777 [Pristionchus pacificus]